MDAPAAPRTIFARPRSYRRLWLIAAAAPVALLLLLAAFPWGLVAARSAATLSRALGRPVTIGGARRVDTISFSPVVELEAVAIAQPAWAGTGTMARIARVRVRFAALPLLLGRFRPHAIDLDGAHLDLRRTATGRANWEGEPNENRAHRPLPRIAQLRIANSTLNLIDLRRHIALDAALMADPNGLIVTGQGRHRGMPLTLALRGAPLDGSGPAPDRPYPMTLEVRSPLATLTGQMMLARPLDLSRMTARFAARGTDLTYLDDIVQAGLFHTRSLAITGTIHRDRDDWRIDRVAGRIGRSDLVVSGKVARAGGRTKLALAVDAATLDFDDFTSAAQRAHGAARRRADGPRVIPATPIRLDALGRLDGTVRLHARRLLDAAPFRTLDATLALDDRRLVAAPIRAALTSGVLTGRATVDHRGRVPHLALDVSVDGARIERLLLTGGEIAGPMRAHLRLAGAGVDLRAALAHADGRVGFVVPHGDARRDYMIFAGGDVLRSVGTLISGDKAARTPVRCLVGAFAARGGTLVPSPLVLDTAVARADGSGRITLGDERIALALTGRGADPGLLQSTAPVRLFGTLSDPKLDIRPPRAPSQAHTGLFGRIGFLIKGLKTRGDTGRDHGAAPAPCAALARAALR